MYAARPSILDQNVPGNEGHLLELSMAAALIMDVDDRVGVWQVLEVVAICFINFSPVQYPSRSLPYKNVTHAHWPKLSEVQKYMYISKMKCAMKCEKVREVQKYMYI